MVIIISIKYLSISIYIYIYISIYISGNRYNMVPITFISIYIHFYVARIGRIPLGPEDPLIRDVKKTSHGTTARRGRNCGRPQRDRSLWDIPMGYPNGVLHSMGNGKKWI